MGYRADDEDYFPWKLCVPFKTVQTKAAGKMLTRVVNEPFDILCADFVGPLPLSKQGNSMLLVFHDVFSK